MHMPQTFERERAEFERVRALAEHSGALRELSHLQTALRGAGGRNEHLERMIGAARERAHGAADRLVALRIRRD
jgi:hypothetical protein